MPDTRHRTILIVGGDGSVGCALRRCFSEQENTELHWTSRRSPRQADSTESTPLPFDALNSDAAEALPHSDAAFLCFGATRMDDCVREPEETARVNVEVTAALAERLVSAGTRVAVFSTTRVFDGRTPWVRHDTARSPFDAYGAQKARLEERILTLGNAAAVFRLSKFLESLRPLVTDWCRRLRDGQPIEPFYDRRIAPFGEGLLHDTAEAFASGRIDGIVHLSGEIDITYDQLAAILVAELAADDDLVRPVSVFERLNENPPGYPWPEYASLAMGNVERSNGLAPTPVDAVRRWVRAVVDAEQGPGPN